MVFKKFPRQNSNIVNREFIIEEDFEEDETTPREMHRNRNKSKEKTGKKML